MRWVMPLLMLCGCSEVLPCEGCPSVTGTYDVSWSADASVSDGGSCLGPRSPQFTLSQRNASQVTTELAGTPLGGTYYETYDLLLTGGSAGVNYRLKGLVIPLSGQADAGIRIQGTLTTRQAFADQDVCESVERFTALKR